jgi:hypothetical protein
MTEKQTYRFQFNPKRPKISLRRIIEYVGERPITLEREQQLMWVQSAVGEYILNQNTQAEAKSLANVHAQIAKLEEML